MAVGMNKQSAKSYKLGDPLATKTNFCGLKYNDLLASIGDSIKIYHTGGVYSTLNETDIYDWPSEKIRMKSGESGWGEYRPKNGEVGELIHVFETVKTNDPYILLLKIGDLFVPISCRYVVKKNELDIKEESGENWKLDSLKNLKYADGCIFKADGRNGGCWARQDYAEIDIAAEDFSCNLIHEGVDTVLLAKYLSGNGVSQLEHACVFWMNDGQAHFKRIDVDKHLNAIPSEEITVESTKVFDFFFENKIDTVTTDPIRKLYISHEHGYLVQLYTPENFFCQKLTGTHLSGDPTHIKAEWWSLMMSEIDANSSK